ncbi:MAG TPA: ABC transporter ATP-binding protein [Acidisoma sp.]|nr:ABC transporter ATP-binding protein [Acidisoma sp.]
MSGAQGHAFAASGDLADGAPAGLPVSAPGLEVLGVTKRFGDFTALADISLRLHPGTVHALLGENGAGKSTLVKCIMGFYHADAGELLLDGREITVGNPRDAQQAGIGMVYQHFTLVPSMTVLENLTMGRGFHPGRIDWKRERATLTAFLETMPFRVPIDRPVSALAAGEKQKAEILKQLYLKARLLILDEPTSVLTPQEADEMLGLIRSMAVEGQLTVLIITHKFREVLAFADEVTVLRRGRHVGGGKVSELSVAEMAQLMVGDQASRDHAGRVERGPGEVMLALTEIAALDDAGGPALHGVTFDVRRGEIVGIAGVSGNGQTALVEVLGGQRRHQGMVAVGGEPFGASRAEIARHNFALLPEEPLRNACVGRMSVGENMAFRSFDCTPIGAGIWVKRGALRRHARDLVERYNVRTTGIDAPIMTLSGGNVQRAVLGRELSGAVDVLVCANPVFGLDFSAVADIHGQIVAARNRGAAVLLVSEDLDELLELADRILVMSGGTIVYETPRASADRQSIGLHMAGHA